MRQDPDIILVGETRDKETAHTAMEAALTGHMVFTTLHANDTSTAITRLAEMEIPPYLIGSSIVGVMAQRLVRKVCSKCSYVVNVDPIKDKLAFEHGIKQIRKANTIKIENKKIRLFGIDAPEKKQKCRKPWLTISFLTLKFYHLSRLAKT